MYGRNIIELKKNNEEWCLYPCEKCPNPKKSLFSVGTGGLCETKKKRRDGRQEREDPGDKLYYQYTYIPYEQE